MQCFSLFEMNQYKYLLIMCDNMIICCLVRNKYTKTTNVHVYILHLLTEYEGNI